MSPGRERRARDDGPEPAGLARRGLLEPLVGALSPSSLLACWVDDDPESEPVWPDAGGRVRATGRAEELPALLAAARPEVVWCCGHPGWHGLRPLGSVLADYARSAAAPVVLVEGPPPVAPPSWSHHEAYAAGLAQAQSAQEGLRLATEELARALDPHATVLWCAPEGGGGAVLPAATSARLSSWLAGRGALLEALRRAHEGRASLIAQNFELFELLDRAQRTGSAVVRSLRFRVGTRIVRAARRLGRREEVFRAPREILARQAVVDSWRGRLTKARDVSDLQAPPGALKVTFVLPELRLSGGGVVVAELVNALRLLGADARLATLRVRADVLRMPLLDRPLTFDSVPAMQRDLPPADVLVATHWSTAEWVRDLDARGRGGRAAYFVQDYEAWFYPEADTATRAQVRASYGMIADKIVTSAWLGDLLRADGYDSRTIAPGLDLEVFYPRRAPAARPRVLAMARPRTPRRGFETVVAALTRVHEQVPDAEIVLFGERLGEMRLPFPYRGAGVITDRERLARAYSGAHVHFDGSDFQAFGRAALEAMACGTPSVLTDVGGVHEYASNEDNCLLVPPRDADAAAGAIMRVLRDGRLRAALGSNGLDTVARWSMRRRARAYLHAFGDIAGAAPRGS